MKLNELGERKIIKELGKIFGMHAVEDDCAIVPLTSCYFLLLTTDTITGRMHIPETASPWQIGYYACAVNLSDIAAMGGFPVGLLFATTYPKDMEMETVLEIAKGINDCASIHGTAVLGGDTKEGNELVISGTAVGKVKKTMLMRRRGAKPGDGVFITGSVGRGGTAMLKLKNNYDVSTATKELLEIQPRITLARQIVRLGNITSAIDTSDGLASALVQLRELNGVGFRIEWDEHFPVYKDAEKIAAMFNVDILSVIFYGGDYEILFTVDKETSEEFEKKCRRKHCAISRIGTVTKRDAIVLVREGQVRDIQGYGYEHFSCKKHIGGIGGPSGNFRLQNTI